MIHRAGTIPRLFGALLSTAALAHCGRVGFETYGLPTTDESDHGTSGTGGSTAAAGAAGGGSLAQGGAGSGGTGGTGAPSAGGSSTADASVPSAGGTGGATASGGSSGVVDAAAGGAEGGLAVGAILVTTVVDELDANATPTSPGPPGLSLREAVAYAKAQAGADVIGFEALSGPVLLSSGLAIDDQDALVISGGGQAVDCSAIGNAQACVTVSANDVTIESLELDACPGKALLVDSTTSFRLESSTIQGCDGVQINSNVGSAVVRGNRVDSSSGDCFTVQAAAEMLDNEISNCGGVAIKVSSTVAAVGTVVRGNLIYLTDTGVLLGLNSDDSVVDHNTIGDASIDAINLAASVAGVFVRNNALVSSQHGLNGSDGQFAARSNNLYWSNSAADCSGCTVDASSLLSDPLFENEAARDYRPQPLSPLVDAGVDTGADRNGSAAGNFNGTAPDIGYYEL